MDTELTLAGHLSELRKRIIYALIPFLGITIFCVFFVKQIFYFLRLPGEGVINGLAFFSPQEVAVVYLRVAVFSGLVLSIPVILYQVWRFVQPALEEKHKKYIAGFVLFGFLSFLSGCAFAYFYLVPVSLRFLISLGGNDFTPVISIDKYLAFTLSFIFACGLVFEMPAVIWILSRLAVVSSAFLRRKRKYAVVVIFVLAAIITPTTDPFNLCLMALPMVILYEAGIWIARWNKK